MHLRLNPRSKTLWLQAAVASAWAGMPELRFAFDGHEMLLVLTHCALTAFAYVVQVRKPRPVLSMVRPNRRK